MAVSESSLREPLSSALPGVGRALVIAGKVSQKAAEEVHRKALATGEAYIPELIQSGAICDAKTIAGIYLLQEVK